MAKTAEFSTRLAGFQQQNEGLMRSAQRSIRAASPYGSTDLYTGTPRARSLVMGTASEEPDTRFFHQQEQAPRELLLDRYPVRSVLDVGRDEALRIMLHLRKETRPKDSFFPNKEAHIARTQDKIDAGHGAFVFDGEKPIGSVLWSFVGDPELYDPEDCLAPAVYVSQRMVLPAYQKRGIGEGLRDIALHEGVRHGAYFARNDVIDHNIDLQQSYLKEGRYFLRSPYQLNLPSNTSPEYVSPSTSTMEEEIRPFDSQLFKMLKREPVSFAKLLESEDPFSTVPELTPQVMTHFRRGDFEHDENTNVSFHQPGGTKSWLNHCRTRLSTPLSAYCFFDDILDLKNRIGLADFIGFIGVTGHDVNSENSQYKFKEPQKIVDVPTINFLSIERPIDTQKAFERAWFGFEKWANYEGNGPLLRGEINGNGNLTLADGSCIYLSDCSTEYLQIAIPTNRGNPDVLFDNYVPEEHDNVHVRLTKPQARNGEISRTHATILKMERD